MNPLKDSKKPFPAWMNTASGTIIPRNKGNAAFGEKATVIPIQAVWDEQVGDFVNANGEEAINTAVNSKSLTRIVSSINATDKQRAELVAAGLALKGGEKMMIDLGLYDPATDNVAPQPTSDDKELEAMKKASGSKVKAKTGIDDL